MTQILNKVREVDPNNAEAVKDVVNTFFQNVTKIGDSDPIKWLRTLGDVINRFPKYCMSHRGTIETILTTAIDSHNYYYVIEAAKCSQAVQQVRPSQEKTATPKTSWQNQMSLLCNAAHSLLSAIFPNAVELYIEEVLCGVDIMHGKEPDQSTNSSLSTSLLNISAITGISNIGEKKSLLQRRLRNVFCFIQAMLVEVYPVAKPVRPLTVLDLVVRAVSVSGGLKSPDIDVSVIKTEALRTLDALIACLGANLIPFSPLVFRLLMQTFRWSSESTDQDVSKVRCSAYNSIGSWLNVLHCHRSAADGRVSWEDELTNHILHDTAPQEKVVQLTMGPQPTKHMSKKAKRKLANANLLQSSIASHMPGEKNKISRPEEMNNEVKLAALECAETFLLVCGRFLNPTTHKLLQERVIRECYNAHKYSEELLMLLLRVAEATRKTVPFGVPPPTQYCLQMYSTLLNSAHREISKFCTQALLDIRMHLHCSPPSLNFALEVPQEQQTSASKRTVSEKNRAALESLLGPDKMASLYNQEACITISDEPSSKKQRLDEEPEQITISSGSDSSVEISDDSDIELVDVRKGEVIRVKKITSVLVENVRAENFSNENSGSDFVDNNISNTIESMIVEYNTDAPDENSLSEKSVIVTNINVDSETIVESEPLKENCKSNEVAVDQEKVECNEVTIDKEMVECNEDVLSENNSIFEAPTQVPIDVSTETVDVEHRPSSLEVDHHISEEAIVNVLDKVDDDILPSCEPDDDMITCGQVVKNSEEAYYDKKSDEADVSQGETEEVPKINGNVSGSDVVENGADIPAEKKNDNNVDVTKVMSKDATITKESIVLIDTIVSKDESVSIEDMMADFVDEVNEEFKSSI